MVHTHAASVASTYKRALIMGDVNLDMMRRHDRQYYRYKLMEDLQVLENVGFRFAGPESPTFYILPWEVCQRQRQYQPKD